MDVDIISRWQMDDSFIEQIGDISYYQHLAQIAERGNFDVVFLQIIKLLMQTIQRCLRFGLILSQFNRNCSSDLSCWFGTHTSTFSNPFTAARQLLSLDHITQGRGMELSHIYDRCRSSKSQS